MSFVLMTSALSRVTSHALRSRWHLARQAAIAALPNYSHNIQHYRNRLPRFATTLRQPGKVSKHLNNTPHHRGQTDAKSLHHRIWVSFPRSPRPVFSSERVTKKALVLCQRSSTEESKIGLGPGSVLPYNSSSKLVSQLLYSKDFQP